MNAPLDPECPEVVTFTNALFDDPLTEAMCAPADEIMEAFARKHRTKCPRCQEYGAANIEV